MKIQEALDILHNKPKGFMVCFGWFTDSSNRVVKVDYFPDKYAGESLIPTEWEAWDLLERFARATKGRSLNLYVVDDQFKPVKDYDLRRIVNT